MAKQYIYSDKMLSKLKEQLPESFSFVLHNKENNEVVLRCKLCGEIKKVKALHTHTPKCTCSGGRSFDYEAKKKEITERLAAINLVPDFTGHKTIAGQPVKLTCTICKNTHISTTLTSKRDFPKGCPYCLKLPLRNIDRTKMYSNRMEELGVSLNEEVKDPKLDLHSVTCLACGYVYQTRLNKSNFRMCPNCKKETNKFRSHRELLITDFLRKRGITVFPNYRLADNSELDLYLPDFNVAFEFNGYFWHNSGSLGKPKTYHSDKTTKCLSLGIKLYHFWEDTPDDLVKSIILSKLNLSPTKIYARNCTVSESVPADFFTLNHKEGNTRFLVGQFSLLYKGQVVAALSMRNPITQRTSDTERQVEIARFAVLKGTSVVGGFSKLLKTAEKYARSVGYTQIVTYCDRDLSPDLENTVYNKNGFNYEGNNLICKYYTYKSSDLFVRGQVHSRQSLQRHKVVALLNKHNILIDSTLTTDSLLEKYLHIVPVYNSGNFKFTKPI